MNLEDLIDRKCLPEPWEEGDKLPWNHPGFSERMLRVHLSQSHDGASRRLKIIDRHVQWLHETVLSARPSRILDLGCGPGLYLQRLATLGHDCVGIDYSPASIAYARETAEREKLSIQYVQEDIRTADLGTGFDLAMLIWGEFSTFSPADAKALVSKAKSALCDSGQLVLEVHPFDEIRRQGSAPAKWNAARSDLFSASPHLYLEETFWNESQRATTTRYFIIEASASSITTYASSSRAYTDDEFQGLQKACGFPTVTSYPSLTGEDEGMTPGVFVLRAGKGRIR